MGKAAFCQNNQNNTFGNSLNISYLLIIYAAIFVRFNFHFNMLVYCHVKITVFHLMKFLLIKKKMFMLISFKNVWVLES